MSSNGGKGAGKGSKPSGRGRSYGHELRQHREFVGGDFSRPTPDQIHEFSATIRTGHDYTKRDETRYIHPATGDELKALFGSNREVYQTQRPKEMDYTTPEWDAFLAAQRIRELPADRSTLGGVIKDTFYTVDGERRGIGDVFDKMFKDDEAHFNKNTNPFHSIIKPSEQSELTREYQQYKQYQTKKSSTDEDYLRNLDSLQHKASADEISYRLQQLEDEHKRTVELDSGSFRPIPEIEAEHWKDLAEGGSPSYLYHRRGQTFRDSEMYKNIPFAGALYDLVFSVSNPNIMTDSPKVITQMDERISINKSAQEIRDSVQELTPDSLSQMFLYDQGEYSEAEERRRIDLYFRQQYALLEDLSNQGILDVPLLSDSSKRQAVNTMNHNLTMNILPQMISSNPINDLPHNPVGFDTFFSSTLSTKDSVDYRIAQLLSSEHGAKVTPEKEGLFKLAQTNQMNNLSAHPSLRDSLSPPNSLHPNFLSTSNVWNGQIEPDEGNIKAKMALQSPAFPKPAIPEIIKTVSSWFWGTSPDNQAVTTQLAQIAIDHDEHANMNKKALNNLINDNSSNTIGKSVREVAAEHMRSLNNGTYFKTNTPKGKLLAQLEQLQGLLRNPEVPPHMKGQLKIYQQQAFLAYYQLDFDEKHGSVMNKDQVYLKQAQDERLGMGFDEDRAWLMGVERFSVPMGSLHSDRVRIESDYAMQRLARKDVQCNALGAVKQGIGRRAEDNAHFNNNVHTASSRSQFTINPTDPSPFRPLYNYQEPALHPVKRRFDLSNTILKNDVTPLMMPGTPVATSPSFHPCDQFDNLFRHCVMDHMNNVVPCRAQYKALQICQKDHADRKDPSHPSPISPYYTPPGIEVQTLHYPRRSSRLVDKFTIDTTFNLE